MFSYFKRGIKDTNPQKSIDIQELASIIKDNPNKVKIAAIRILKRAGNEYYKQLKEELPNITPNCTVKKRKLSDNNFSVNFLKGSLYLFLDIDNIKNINRYKEEFLCKYRHLVAMVCVSTSGDGLSVLIKISASIESESQFIQTKKYIIDTYFKDIEFDNNAGGIGRAMFISHDPDVYINPDNEIYVPDNFTNGITRGLNQSILSVKDYIILNETSLPAPIGDVLRRIYSKTYVDVKKPVMELKPEDYAEVKFSKNIKDGNKHRVYTGIIHSLVRINRDADPHDLYSYLYYINENYANPPMLVEKLVSLFNFVYSSIVDDPDYIYRHEKKKYIHFNKNSGLNGNQKRIIASKLNGKRRRNNSIEKILLAKEELVSQGEKVSQKKIAEKSGLALCTVKRNFHKCPENLDVIIEALNSKEDPFDVDIQHKLLQPDPLSRWQSNNSGRNNSV